MVGLVTKGAGVAAAASALVAMSWPYLRLGDSIGLQKMVTTMEDYLPFTMTDVPPVNETYSCSAHNYTTQIVSIDPLLIYIHNFLTDADIDALTAAGEDLFAPSTTSKDGKDIQDPDRTSVSAFLPVDNDAVQCILERARRFAGAILRDGYDEMGVPQLVRYTEGQKFNSHCDWFPKHVPRAMPDGSTRKWNRIVSFFATLEDTCGEGETWFPYVQASTMPSTTRGLWREHPNGGLAFRPVKGNSLFWVNLKEDGSGDGRVEHAGLPLTGGRKTAMNIWPQRYLDE